MKYLSPSDFPNFKVFGQTKKEGFLGQSFLVSDRNGSFYILKILNFENLSNNKNDFFNQTEKLTQISHPSLIQFSFLSNINFLNQNFPMFFTPFVGEHCSLGDYFHGIWNHKSDQLSNLEIMTPTQKYIILLGIAAGMYYLHHKCNIIHADLKPSNILLDLNKYPLISDYGISSIFLREKRIKYSKDLSVVSCMPPELILRKEIGKYSDVYSFGMISYQLITNHISFPKITKRKDLIQLIKLGISPFSFTSNKDDDITPIFKELLERCMSIDIKKRPKFDHIYSLLRNDLRYIFNGADINEINNFKLYLDNNILKTNSLLNQTELAFESEENQIHINNANNGNIDEMLYVGESKVKGLNGFSKDKNGEIFLIKAAKADLPQAEIEYADYLINKKTVESYTHAFKLLDNAIQKGIKNISSRSKCKLAFMFKFGLGVPADLKLSAQLLKESAEENCIEGLIGYGQILENGEGTNFDPEKAAIYYKKAMELGSNQGKALYGRLLVDGESIEQNINLGVKYITESMKSGDCFGINQFGYLYEKGIGVRKNPRTALLYFLLAAERGDTYAMNNCGNLYEKGIKSMIDENKAVHYYKRAAKLGDTFALWKYSDCLLNGTGVKKNQQKAIQILQKAVDAGNNRALYKLAKYYDKSRDNKKAIELYKQLAVNEFSFYKYGFFLEKGFGCESNPSLAVEYYKKSVKRHEKDGIFRLAMCYINGIGVPCDQIQALKYLKIGTELGHPVSKKYYHKNLSSMPTEEAMKFITENIDYSNAYSLKEHADIFYYGLAGVPKDMNKAMELYQKASDLGLYFRPRS
ncbi:hypothetical protein TRFO_32746 [Tritrichomonas foetus]|uniref:Protein kinase domain-containing protein n=1 Tax=Tritrichomonas foetus TaxID=1144522 RepID=A0A1J4JSM9_9EUKA|nr:hypothetical protein TRFO_32746 [Tritrichomonas foetus]|eukprot:OHT00516.1 hypothetical protein TRFO_32746 [Tritrichomonas foetus]